MKIVKGPISFDAAHVLPSYDGLCSNLHGHTYKVEVILLSGSTEKKDGMLVDFKVMKEVIMKIIDEYDHAVIINNLSEDNFEIELKNLLLKSNKKVKLLQGETTAENIAEDIGLKLQETCLTNKFITLGVKLYETPTSYVEVW